MPIFKLKLLSQHEVAKNTIEFHFEKPEGLQFTPGQYGGFTLINPPETDADGITRRFSLLSTPEDTHIAIAMRVQKSAFKRVLVAQALGSEIKFAGPSGNFILPEDKSIPVVLIAGGIGITPFYSMLRAEAQQHSTRKIILFYGNQSTEYAAYLNELNTLQQQNPHFTFIPTLANPPADWSGETGYITYTLLKKYLPDITLPIYYVCGAASMVNVLQETLLEMDISTEKIKVEDFPGY